MVWVKLDDGFAENGKVQSVGDRAFRLHIAALCFCGRNLTDGLVTHHNAKVIAASVGASKRHILELETARLWIPCPPGHAIKDFTDYNPTAEEVKAERAKNAQRQRDHRARRNAITDSLGNAVSNGVTNGVSHASPSRPSPSHPLLALANSQPYNPQGADEQDWGTREQRLLRACAPVPDLIDAETKFRNALKGCTEADVQAAIEAARNPKTRDKFGMALSVLKKRRNAA